MEAESGHYITIGTFCFHRVPSISGDSASCSYLVISSKSHRFYWKRCDVEQSFLLSIMFRDAGTLFWLNEMLLENEHEVRESFVIQKNIVQNMFVNLLRS